MNKLKRSVSTGAAMVEFALVLPLLLVLVLGTIEIGRALYLQNTLYKAVETGVRYLARKEGYIEYNGDTAPYCTTGSNSANDELAAKNLIVYGKHTPLSTDAPLVPGLTTTDVKMYPPTSDQCSGISLGPTRKQVYDDHYACIISISVCSPYSGLFGDYLPINTLNAESEGRYIGN